VAGEPIVRYLWGRACHLLLGAAKLCSVPDARLVLSNEQRLMASALFVGAGDVLAVVSPGRWSVGWG
jgi:hypothetical protein